MTKKEWFLLEALPGEKTRFTFEEEGVFPEVPPEVVSHFKDLLESQGREIFAERGPQIMTDNGVYLIVDEGSIIKENTLSI